MHPEPGVVGPAPDRGDLVGGVDGAGRVGRADHQQHLGARGAGRLELLDRDLVAGCSAPASTGDRDAAGEVDRLRVGGPVRRRHEHLVARVEQGRERLVDRLLAAVGDEHLAARSRSRSRAWSCRRSPGAARAGQPWGCSGASSGRGTPSRRRRRCARGSRSPARRPRTRSRHGRPPSAPSPSHRPPGWPKGRYRRCGRRSAERDAMSSWLSCSNGRSDAVDCLPANGPESRSRDAAEPGAARTLARGSSRAWRERARLSREGA